MNFRARIACTIFLLLVTYFLVDLLLRPTRPTNVLTKYLYEPGHDINNPLLCSKERNAIKVLIVVITAPGNRRHRMSIRKAWGNASHQDFAIVFFVGRSLLPEENLLTDEESLIYSDIVRGKNIDSYQNLTLKTISFLEWTDTYCSNVRFVLKVDDDVFVNVANLMTFINDKRGYERSIFGELASGLSPLWWPPKWYVSYSEYDKGKYPDFVFGPAYLLTVDTIHWLYRGSLWTTFFKLEDVFITGIVAESLNINRIHSPFFIRIGHSEEIAKSDIDIYQEAEKRITIHDVEPESQMKIWNSFQLNSRNSKITERGKIS